MGEKHTHAYSVFAHTHRPHSPADWAHGFCSFSFIPQQFLSSPLQTQTLLLPWIPTFYLPLQDEDSRTNANVCKPAAQTRKRFRALKRVEYTRGFVQPQNVGEVVGGSRVNSDLCVYFSRFLMEISISMNSQILAFYRCTPSMYSVI